VPASPRAHTGKHCLRHVREPEDVGVEHRSHLRVLSLFHGREITVPRVVDEQVDLPEFRDCLLDRRSDLRPVGDVEWCIQYGRISGKFRKRRLHGDRGH